MSYLFLWETIYEGSDQIYKNSRRQIEQAATEWTPDCLQKWYNFDQKHLSKLLQLTMKSEFE